MIFSVIFPWMLGFPNGLAEYSTHSLSTSADPPKERPSHRMTGDHYRRDGPRYSVPPAVRHSAQPLRRNGHQHHQGTLMYGCRCSD